jgi:hypothetical protein
MLAPRDRKTLIYQNKYQVSNFISEELVKMDLSERERERERARKREKERELG